MVARDRIELPTFRFSGWQTARPKTIGSVPYGSDFTPLTGPFSPGLPPRTPVPGSCAPCVITPHVHSAPPFADPPGDTPDPVSRADPDPWHGDDHLDHEVNEEDATALTGLRPGDGPLSIRARPSSLKHDCDRRTTSTDGKFLVNVHAKSCLTLEPLRALRSETKGQAGACPDRARAIPCNVRAVTWQSS